MSVPRYTDGLTRAVYDGLCRALYLQQRCATPQRAFELELRFGQLFLNSTSSSRVPLYAPFLTPTVLVPSEREPHRFSSRIQPAVMSRLERAVHNLGQLHARQARTAFPAASTTRPPMTELVVLDEEQNIRLLYACAGRRRDGAGDASAMMPPVYSLVTAQRKQALDAMDITCMAWMTDMRLAIASEQTVDPRTLITPSSSSSSQTASTNEKQDPAVRSPLSLPISPTRCVARLKNCVRVHRYVECHVVHEKLLLSSRNRAYYLPYMCGDQLSPTPPLWQKIAVPAHMRVELEFDLKAIRRDWSQLSGSKATRAVLEHYDRACLPTKQVERTVVTAPIDPFLRSVVEDVLAISQFLLKPE